MERPIHITTIKSANYMKIALISLFVPTPENQNGASALPYHILSHRNASINIHVYTWNLNNVPKDQIRNIELILGIKITVLKVPYQISLCTTPIISLLRIFLKYPFLRYLSIGKNIRKNIMTEYDAVWIYGEEISHIGKYFIKHPVTITTPDCEAMYYSRLLSMPEKIQRTLDYIRHVIMYRKYLKLAKDFPSYPNIKYHLVGNADCKFLKSINPYISAHFIPHPHYNYDNSKIIDFNKSKIKILIAGRYDLYMKEGADEAINTLINNPYLADTYKITFLGKGWEFLKAQLDKSGYEVSHLSYVPIYAKELINHDIQLSPISLGTGTKGKVLDAFVNGLLVIGTKRALENIQANNCKDYYLYSTGNDLARILNTINADRETAKTIAMSGRDTVRRAHNQTVIASRFFNLFIN